MAADGRKATPTGSAPGLLGRALVIVGVLLGASTLLLRLADPDTFQHIAIGRWIVAHRAIATHDPFSYASAGPVRYTEALADVILYAADSAMGVKGLALLHVLLGIAILSLVVLRAQGSAPARVLVTGLVIVGSYTAMTLKPQLFSYLLFAALLVVIDRAPRKDPRRLFALPVLFLAWANLHRGGVFGIAVLAAAAFAWWCHPSTRKHAAVLSAVTVLCFFALFASSGGAYYVTSAFAVVDRASFHARIVEWQPLSLRGILEHHAAILPLLFLAAAERALRGRRIDPEILILGLSLALSLKGARLLPFAAIAAAPPATRALDALRVWLSRRARPAFLDALLVLLGLVAPIAHYERTVPPAYRGVGICDAVVPVDLARFFAVNRPPGHLFHSFGMGGYFLYALGPETQVLIDGRNDTVYDDAFFEAVTDAETNRAVFDALDRRYAFAVAAFRWSQFGDPDGAFLSRDPSWVLIYWDDVSVVYAHRRRAAAMADAFGYRELRVDRAVSMASTPATGSEDAQFMTDLRRNVGQAPRSLRAHYLLAVALRARGAQDEARSEAAIARELARARGTTIPDVGP